MPSPETYAKFGELLFGFDYNLVINQTNLFSDVSDQIEYLLFVISEAKRVINIFNLFEDDVVSINHILNIKPPLEAGFLLLLTKYGDKNLKVYKSNKELSQANLIFDARAKYYEYIDKVQATISLVEVELNYRKNLLHNVQQQSAYTYKQESLFVNEAELIPRIKWLSKKEQLLQLFALLNNHGFIGEYKTEQILDHFLVENPLIRIKYFSRDDKKFQWLGSDNEFCFLINQLVKKKLVPSHKKYKIVGGHFINREGSNFKYLAQKHNFSKNYLQSKPVLIGIVEEVLSSHKDIYN